MIVSPPLWIFQKKRSGGPQAAKRGYLGPLDCAFGIARCADPFDFSLRGVFSK